MGMGDLYSGSFNPEDDPTVPDFEIRKIDFVILGTGFLKELAVITSHVFSGLHYLAMGHANHGTHRVNFLNDARMELETIFTTDDLEEDFDG